MADTTTSGCTWQKVGLHLLFFFRFIQLGSVAVTGFVYCYLTWHHNNHYCAFYPLYCDAEGLSQVQVPWEYKVTIAAVCRICHIILPQRLQVDFLYLLVHSRFPGKLHIHHIFPSSSGDAKLSDPPLHYASCDRFHQFCARCDIAEPYDIGVLLVPPNSWVNPSQRRKEKLCDSCRWICVIEHCYVSIRDYSLCRLAS